MGLNGPKWGVTYLLKIDRSRFAQFKSLFSRAGRHEGVHTANAGALEFYRRLGAVAAEVCIMSVSGERLRALADAAP